MGAAGQQRLAGGALDSVGGDVRRRQRAGGPSLGRNLSGGATANRTINLIDPGTEFAEGWKTQLDFRVSGSYDVRGLRFQPSIDLFNAFSASTVLGANARYGPVWQNPTSVLGGRVVRLGARVGF